MVFIAQRIKSFVHLLGGTNKDVIELQMSRVDANYFKRKGDSRDIKNEKKELAVQTIN